MSQSKQIEKHLETLGNLKIVSHSKRFFKTGPGEYGEGDEFLGIRVPVIRQQVKKFKGLSLSSSLQLLQSKFHEVRLFAVLMMVDSFEKGDEHDKTEIYHAYLANTHWINNWDIVDSSAHKIVGAYLLSKSRKPLYQLASSEWLWDKRIAMIACYFLIKRDDFEDTLELAKFFFGETHDLMHKAVGWMLREVGNRDYGLEDWFLANHYQNMPRTMLRYAIEKFPKTRKQAYMKGKV